MVIITADQLTWHTSSSVLITTVNQLGGTGKQLEWRSVIVQKYTKSHKN